MKKRLALFAAIFFAGMMIANAQGGGGGMRRTVEERVATVHSKIDSAFNPAGDKLKRIDVVFTTYYTAQDKIREELMSGGERPDMETMRAKMQVPTEARDKDLKTLLTDDQFKKFKDEIEPSLRPRGGNGGGGGRPRN